MLSRNTHNAYRYNNCNGTSYLYRSVNEKKKVDNCKREKFL